MELYFTISIFISILYIAGNWMVFKKSNLPGWGALIPFYNLYLLCKVAKISPIFMVFFFIPIINLFAFLLIYLTISERFGKNTPFGLGLMFLGFIFLPVLGFGKSEYKVKLDRTLWYNILVEITQPFVDLIHAPRALWGVNLGYLIEGMVYFGILGYLAIYFSDFVFQGIPFADEISHNMVMFLTAGITISMFFLGFVADKYGVRFALLSAFVMMLFGRIVISAASTIFGFEPNGLWSSLHLTTMAGILFVVIGYGMYQPAAYAAVRKFTTPKTAAMGFAMLYALMNLGGYLPSWAFLLRDEDFLGFGITGVFWIYTGFTVLALLITYFILSKKTVKNAEQKAKEETEELIAKNTEEKSDKVDKAADTANEVENKSIPIHLWGLMIAFFIAIYLRVPEPLNYYTLVILVIAWFILSIYKPTKNWIANHPLADNKFFFFIFALIPVQTLFTYNWLVLPQYINRAFEGWIGEYFEFAANLNPILIFIAVPIITAITQKAKVYNMMIWGTLIMSLPAFLLVIGPYPWTLFTYIFIMTIGEAMWQPRFLQYAAEIAPEGRTGVYMGVAQLPWFLTKMLVPWLYSGWMMDKYCPADGPKDTETMWFYYALIAISSTVLLLLARNWIGKDFKTKSA
jgi:MFS family permease